MRASAQQGHGVKLLLCNCWALHAAEGGFEKSASHASPSGKYHHHHRRNAVHVVHKDVAPARGCFSWALARLRHRRTAIQCPGCRPMAACNKGVCLWGLPFIAFAGHTAWTARGVPRGLEGGARGLPYMLVALPPPPWPPPITTHRPGTSAHCAARTAAVMCLSPSYRPVRFPLESPDCVCISMQEVIPLTCRRRLERKLPMDSFLIAGVSFEGRQVGIYGGTMQAQAHQPTS